MMPLLLAVALAIHQINPALPDTTVREYAGAVVAQADAQALDPWLLVEIVHRESHWIASLVRHENDGTCSVGLGQINGSCATPVVAPLLEPRTNIARTASVLAYLRSHCTHRCRALAWVRAYNPGSRGYASDIIGKVRRRHHAATPTGTRRRLSRNTQSRSTCRGPVES
jgi:hypothetical protein